MHANRMSPLNDIQGLGVVSLPMKLIKSATCQWGHPIQQVSMQILAIHPAIVVLHPTFVAVHPVLQDTSPRRHLPQDTKVHCNSIEPQTCSIVSVANRSWLRTFDKMSQLDGEGSSD